MKEYSNNLYGLILTGGKSARLGKDKYLMEYHGKPQVQYLYNLLVSVGLETHISCNKEQAHNLKPKFPLIVDKFKEIGPMGALSAAFDINPKGAWLVVACDLPFINEATIKRLINERSHEHLLTTYQEVNSNFFETTISIYEPEVSAAMNIALNDGQYSLRKAIDNSQIKIIQSTNPQELFNANTQEEVDFAKAKLKSSDIS